MDIHSRKASGHKRRGRHLWAKGVAGDEELLVSRRKGYKGGTTNTGLYSGVT